MQHTSDSEIGLPNPAPAEIATLKAELAAERQANADLRSKVDAVLATATRIQELWNDVARGRDEARQQVAILQRQLRSAENENAQLKHSLDILNEASRDARLFGGRDAGRIIAQ